MTRPMPGPPEKYQVLRRYVLVWRGGVEHYQHSSEIDAKRLTDAECAAHYWQAFCYRARAPAEIINLPPHEARRIVKESDTWHRFDTHHHALEES